MANGKILTADQEMQLRQPIDDYVGKIQKKIDGLRVDGTDRVVSLQNTIDNTKRDRTLTKGEKENRISALKAEVNKAKAVEEKNKGEISGLIADAEAYLKAHYNNTSRQCPDFPTIRRSRTRNMSTGTGSSMQRWICRKTFSRSRTEDMPHIHINII